MAASDPLCGTEVSEKSYLWFSAVPISRNKVGGYQTTAEEHKTDSFVRYIILG